MKKIGSTCEFIGERNRELHASFMKVLRESRDVPLRDMYGLAAKQRCSRFWVSPERVVAAIGRHNDDQLDTRRRMYEELERRIGDYRREHPRSSLIEAATAVVYSEAPEFYLTPLSAERIIYRIRQQRKARKDDTGARD